MVGEKVKYGLIGEKLGHSFSKDIHEKIGGYEYELCEIPKDNLDAFLKEAEFSGINVTIPYKEAVIPHLYELSETAKKIGAVNTIVNKGGKLYGDNTDFYGMKALIEKNCIELSGKKVLILGTGGTSKTAKAVADSLGAKEIFLVSRGGKEDSITYEDVYLSHTDADIIINTTPCGMYPDNEAMPIDISLFKNLSGVVDAIYNPLKSKLIASAQNSGIKAAGGLYMLVSQAVYAAERFMEKPVDKSVTDEIYYELLNDKLNIVLTGMPGCGKSTVGKLLAKTLNKKFVDTDEYITEKYKRTPADIIKLDGEKAFRDIESEAVKNISSMGSQIISTGGGAVLRSENINSLKQNGKIFFIDRPVEDLIPTDDRPLSSTKEDIIKRYNERYDIYCSSADEIVKVTGDARSVAQYIKGRIK